TAKHAQKEQEERYAPDGTQHNTEAITEPNTEKIKDIVAEMPSSEEKGGLPEETPKEDWRNLGVHYDDLPQFEPVGNRPSSVEAEKPTEEKIEEKKEEKAT